MQARNTARLRALGVTHIINVASGYIATSQDYYGRSFNYLGIPCEDTEDFDILTAFEKCKEHYYDAKNKGGAALCTLHHGNQQERVLRCCTGSVGDGR
ncbi:hypothetical protein FOZ60_005525 [Perkinsus olseni]|uniref:Dual specificity protein phosphatase n=1 Tax=Perkinsus olseni TaxID=32597 RepID=A0A7J6PIK4_PEROL|nr:hypothetical protein FOZ60_005525 [Perkinsus olseni]